MKNSTKLIVAFVAIGCVGLALFAGPALGWPVLSTLPTWVQYLGIVMLFVAAFSGTGIGPLGKLLDRLLKDSR